jgi:hypothetical protein
LPIIRVLFCSLLVLSAISTMIPRGTNQGLTTMASLTTHTVTASSLSYSTSYSNYTSTLSTQTSGITLVQTMNATSAQFIYPISPPCYAAEVMFYPSSSPIYLAYSEAEQPFELYVLSYWQLYPYYYPSSGPCIPSDYAWHRSITAPNGVFHVSLTVQNNSLSDAYMLLVTTRLRPNAKLVVSLWPFSEYYEHHIATTARSSFTMSGYANATMTKTMSFLETGEQPASQFPVNPFRLGLVVLLALTVGYFTYWWLRKRTK